MTKAIFTTILLSLGIIVAQGQVRVQVSVNTARRVVTIAPVEGGADVAVSMIDRRISTPDTVTTIASQLLLQSDLRGHVEDAGWYLRGDGRQTAPAADALMLTQGWTRYDLSAVVKGQMADSLEYPLEVGAQLDGVIRSKWRGKPLAGATANVLAPRMADGATAVTDAQGRFHITGLEWPDSTTLVISATNAKGEQEENFTPDFDIFPTIKTFIQQSSNSTDSENDWDDFMARLNSSPQGIQVSLKEVVVRGSRKQKSGNAIEMLSTVNIRPDQDPSIDSYEDAVSHIPGVNIVNDQLMYMQKPVAVWVDGRYIGSADGKERLRNSMGFGATAAPYRRAQEYTAAGGSAPLDIQMLKAYEREIYDIGMLSNQMKLTDLEAMYPFINNISVSYIPPHFAMLFRQGAINDGDMFSRMNGGILSITTQNPSKVRNELSPEFRIVRPLGYQRSKRFYAPKYTVGATSDIQSGAILQWYPTVDISNPVEIPYPSTHSPADITVTVEGITPDGQTVLN